MPPPPSTPPPPTSPGAEEARLPTPRAGHVGVGGGGEGAADGREEEGEEQERIEPALRAGAGTAGEHCMLSLTLTIVLILQF